MPSRLLPMTPFVVAAALVLGHGQTAHGAKAIQVHIEDEGKLVLRGLYSGADRASTAELWRDLAQAPLEALVNFPAEPSNPRQATLTGNLRIVISWDEPLASANVKELRLVRDTDRTSRWQLSPEEVERTAQAAGLQLPWRISPMVPLAAGIMICILVGSIWQRVRRRSPN